MKKFLALALASVMAVSLVACGSTNADTNAESSAAATTTAAATESGSEEPGLKIAIVSSPSGVDDGSFNQDNYNGVLKFIEENPNATVTPIREETGDSAAAVQAVADVVADYDVIVCCGFQFAGIGNLAQENPDTKFILIDSWPTIDGTEVTADQVIDNVYAVNYQYGFECGVKYVNGTEGMNVEVVELPSYAGTDVTGANVGGNYVGNFSDEATGKVLGNALIAEGVDILFVAAGGSGNGVFTAAKEADGVKVIGCDVDQYDDGANGDSNIVLTSGLKVMHDTVYNVLNEVKDGSFKGANVTLTAADDATGFVSEEGRCQLTAEAIEKINAAQALLKEGKIVPAANFNGVTPETFTW